jgi:hypothetical protein
MRAGSLRVASCRAATTAVKFAFEPPDVSRPPLPAGIPSHCLNQSMTRCSTSFGPDAIGHTPAKKLYAVASQSPSTAG